MSIAHETNAQRLISLCKEYTQAVAKIKEEADAVAKRIVQPSSRGSNDEGGQFARTSAFALHAAYQQLRKELLELVRAGSQRIEHSELEFDDRLELKLRLADLQAKLQQADLL